MARVEDDEQALIQFKEKLYKYVNLRDIDIVVNENRSTMLNLLEKRRNRARLSMHRMFLNAPEDVISAIAHYVRGTRRSQAQNLTIRGYIQKNLSKIDCSHLIEDHKLNQIGEFYDLKKIYSELNREYFEDRLDLKITWFGKVKKRRRSRIIFGQYYDGLKLIKIHRILDQPFFPSYFVAFVIYHEMLHSVIPGYVDEKTGLYRIHGHEFKSREKLFRYYRQAIAWEKEHKEQLFKIRF